jgi:hypothetical protein
MATQKRERTSGRRLGAGAAVAMAMFLVAGCTSVRTDLGTSASSCYLALPTASRAVGPHSHLDGVHLYSAEALKREAPRLEEQLAGKIGPGENVCVLAFSGHFSRSSVSKGRGHTSGDVAIAVVTTASNHLLGTVVLPRLPLRFSHSHIG